MSEIEAISQIVEDNKLVQAIRSGNEFVLKRLYKDHFPKIQRMVLHNSGDEYDAKDVYQDAFLVFYENIREEGFELKSSIGTYLYSIARNLWLKKLRAFSRSPEVRIETEGYTVDTEAEVFDHEHREAWIQSLETAMKRIGEPCKTILEDFFFHRKSMEEIARKMNYTNAANAKNQKYKCFNRLKKLIVLNTRNISDYEQ